MGMAIAGTIKDEWEYCVFIRLKTKNKTKREQTKKNVLRRSNRSIIIFKKFEKYQCNWKNKKEIKISSKKREWKKKLETILKN